MIFCCFFFSIIILENLDTKTQKKKKKKKASTYYMLKSQDVCGETSNLICLSVTAQGDGFQLFIGKWFGGY